MQGVNECVNYATNGINPSLVSTSTRPESRVIASYPAVRNPECVKPKFPGLLVSRERQFTAHKDTSHSVVSDSVQATVSEASGRETRSPTPLQYLCVDRGRQLSVKATAVEP